MRNALISLAMASTVLVSGQVFAQPPEMGNSARQQIQTDAGVVQGRALTSGVEAYLGIPYAAPPVRELRWRAPQPPEPWSGTFHADRFAPQCIQPMRGSMTNQYSGADTISEDCLYLNIWSRPGLRKAPVIIYIHGGGFYIGSGSVGIYGGESIARAGAVFVNFNYRVGPLGFLALPELTAESPHHSSGNYGLLDQISALNWVQRNISKFGGDPDNVTIVGQSAGSMAILALQASPLAKGLFHRAVGMSGAMIDGPIRLSSLQQAEQDGTKLMGNWNARSLENLRALPADRLTVPRVAGGPTTGPTVDGYVIPAPIADLFVRKVQNDVPLILGFTRDEALGGLGTVNGLSEWQEKARQAFGKDAEQFLMLYPASNDAEAKAQARIADRDATVAASMFGWAALQSQYGRAPVYTYEFARPHTYDPEATFTDHDPATAGAYHTSEVPFWLGNLDAFDRFRQTRNWKEEDRETSRVMLESLITFARNGTPAIPNRLWPRFLVNRPQLVQISETVAVKNWPDPKRLEFFKAFYTQSQKPTPSRQTENTTGQERRQ